LPVAERVPHVGPSSPDLPIQEGSGTLATLQGALDRPPALDSSGVRKPEIHDSARHQSVLAEVDEARRAAEVQAILAALNSTFWNRKQAAKLLNVDYKALLYKMKKLNISAKAAEMHACSGEISG
jgi:two-component system response regulator AtoC